MSNYNPSTGPKLTRSILLKPIVTYHKVMVTGSGGFIGRYVVDYLKSHYGIDVVEFNLPEHDIRNLDDVVESSKGCQGIIHLAGVLGTHELFDTPQLAVDTNVTGSLNVLEACRINGAAYVGITMPQVFPSIYTATKVATTKLATAYNHTHGVPVSHVRAYNAFGEGQAHGPGHPQKIVPTFAYNAWHGIPIPVWGDGTQTVDLVYSGDLAKMLVEALRYGNDQTFEGGTGTGFTVLQVASMVQRIVDPNVGPLIQFQPMRRGEKPTHIVAGLEHIDLISRPLFDTLDFANTVNYYKDYVIK